MGSLKADGSYTGKRAEAQDTIQSTSGRLITLGLLIVTEEVHSTRTSTNSWCLDKCMQDPVAQNVVKRIEHVTQIPQTNSESLQMLRYEVGQVRKCTNWSNANDTICSDQRFLPSLPSIMVSIMI